MTRASNVIFFAMVLCGILASSSKGMAEEREIKILVLIIASDDFPGADLVAFPYKGFQNVWRSYMHRDKEHVEAYFIRGNPNLAEPYLLEGDVIWSKTEENVIPGILNKTLLSMEYILPRLGEFDFVLRTNLSSFYIFPRLLDFINTLPIEACYCASGEMFGSGSGFILSPDLVEILVESKEEIVRAYGNENDDVAIGRFLRKTGIGLIPAKRTDIVTLDDWEILQEDIPAQDFHFRVKNHLDYERRPIDDVFIQSELAKMFYP